MLIFNTTFLVSDKIYGTWYKWLYEEHIPFMLETNFFVNPQVAKVLFTESSDGTSYSMQFHVENLGDLHKWNEEFGHLFSHEVKRKFGEEVLLFQSVMEIMK